jgi:hypothetical protein
VVSLATLAFAGVARGACAPPDQPLGERFDAADAAAVGRVVSVRAGELHGQPERVLTLAVHQHVKGDLPDEVEVWTPRGTECGLDAVRGETVGLLLTRSPEGRWVATGASVVDPGLLVAEGGKPRGGVIKVAIGLVILALVLLWAMARLRKGKRPDLPGAPMP